MQSDCNLWYIILKVKSATAKSNGDKQSVKQLSVRYS